MTSHLRFPQRHFLGGQDRLADPVARAEKQRSEAILAVQSIVAERIRTLSKIDLLEEAFRVRWGERK